MGKLTHIYSHLQIYCLHFHGGSLVNSESIHLWYLGNGICMSCQWISTKLEIMSNQYHKCMAIWPIVSKPMWFHCPRTLMIRLSQSSMAQDFNDIMPGDFLNWSWISQDSSSIQIGIHRIMPCENSGYSLLQCLWILHPCPEQTWLVGQKTGDISIQ